MSKKHCIFKPLNFDVFIGMDVDKRSISITVLTHEEEVMQRKLPYSSANLLNLVGKRLADKRIAFVYEAGPTGYGLYDDITAAGFTCLVVSPASTPTAPSDRVKTNRLDSRKLAQSLRGAQLKSIHVPSIPYRHLRHLVQLREVLLGQVVAYKNRIKGLLLMEGILFPPATLRCQWTERVIDQLKIIPASVPVRFKLDQLLNQLDFSKTQLAQVTKSIQDFCTNDPEISPSITLLMTIPGIAWIVAMHLLARIGDWRQLRNSRQIAGLLGLVPTENSTGSSINRGSITRLGDPVARNKLIETAWTAIRHDAELYQFFLRICKRHPLHIAKRKAIVAVARKMTTRIFAVLKYRRPYLPQSEYLVLQGMTRR